MCHEYMGHIEQTQEPLYRYLQENPTREEARTNLPVLISKYEDSLSEEAKQITQLMEEDLESDSAS